MINSGTINSAVINGSALRLFAVDIAEEIEVAGDINVNYTAFMRERLTAAASTQTFYNPEVSIIEDMLAVATPRIAFVQQITEEFFAEDTPSAIQVVALAEYLLATGVTQTFYHGVLEVLASILIADRTYYSVSASLLDEVEIEDSAAVVVLRIAQLLDEINVSTSLENVLTIMVQETAEIEAADSIELTATLLANLLEEVDVYTFVKTPSEIAQGWVMNTEGEMPISEYDNYTFNSLVQFNGVFYGANDSGLFAAGGDTDAGEPITAQLGSMMLDFGTSRLKRMRSAYLGYTSTNELVLKVRSVSDGQLFEHWYKACPVTADAPREGKVYIGQGLRSRYWQFELTNVNGGDFEIDQLEMHPLVLSRRV